MRMRRRISPLALGPGIAALLLLGLPAAGEGSVTIGANLAVLTPATLGYNYNGAHQCTVANTTLVPAVTASGGLASPVKGTVVSFQVRTAGFTAPVRLRLLRPAGDPYTGVGASYPVTPPINQISPAFPVNLPIQPGDLIGLDCCQSGNNAITTASSVGSRASWGTGADLPLAEGETRAANANNTGALLVSAEVQPDNSFTLGGVTRNKKKGTATLNLTLPNPGELTGSCNGAKVASALAVISKSVGAGQTQVLIKATGKKKKKLNQ